MVEMRQKALDRFGELVASITDDQWDDPTPCTDWDVRALVNHIVWENEWAAELTPGIKSMDDVGSSLDGDRLGDDPLGAFHRAATASQDAFRVPGAMEKKAKVSFGLMPVPEYLAQLYLDSVIHGWDLATAIGADATIEPEVAELLYAGVTAQADVVESNREAGFFGPSVQVDDDAPAAHKLLAFLGRQP